MGVPALPLASHGCPRAWHSPGPRWDGNRSCLLGLSPLHPVSFGRISSSPDMQRPWGRHVMVCVLVCCAQCCSSCPIHTCMAQTSAPRDSGMDVNGLVQNESPDQSCRERISLLLGIRRGNEYLPVQILIPFSPQTLLCSTPSVVHYTDTQTMGDVTAGRDTRQLQCALGSTFFQTPSHSFLAPLVLPRHPPTGAQLPCQPTTSQAAHFLL